MRQAGHTHVGLDIEVLEVESLYRENAVSGCTSSHAKTTYVLPDVDTNDGDMSCETQSIRL